MHIYPLLYQPRSVNGFTIFQCKFFYIHSFNLKVTCYTGGQIYYQHLLLFSLPCLFLIYYFLPSPIATKNLETFLWKHLFKANVDLLIMVNNIFINIFLNVPAEQRMHRCLFFVFFFLYLKYKTLLFEVKALQVVLNNFGSIFRKGNDRHQVYLFSAVWILTL